MNSKFLTSLLAVSALAALPLIANAGEPRPEEKEVVVFIVADMSRSMRFSTAEYTKRMRMVQVAASLL